MAWVELGCVAVIAFYLAMQLVATRSLEPARSDSPESRWLRAALIAAAAWTAEDTCIRLYGFYGYSREWSVFVGRVPVLVALIWPIVILSAGRVAEATAPRATPLGRALVTALIVLADAALIEPIAVRAGLWSWSVSGIFGVPLIGIVGWALFAFAATLALSYVGRGALGAAVFVLLVPVVTHGMLLAAWWGLMRWLPRPLPDAAGVALAAALALVTTGAALSARRAAPLPLAEYCARMVAAAFFAVLLARTGTSMLLLYAVPFAVPYLALGVRGAVATTSRAAAPRPSAAPGSSSTFQR